MAQIIELLLAVVLSGVSIVALLAVVGALFPRTVENGRQVAERMPGRAFLLGLVNALFLTAVFFASYALGSNLDLFILYLPGLGALALAVAGATFGLVSLVNLVGSRLFPERFGLDRTARAGFILVLACWTPFVGWFALLPYALSLGLGAVIIGLFQRTGAKVDNTEIP